MQDAVVWPTLGVQANTGGPGKHWGSISDNVMLHMCLARALLTCRLVIKGKSFKKFECLEVGWMKLTATGFWLECLATMLSIVVAAINLRLLRSMKRLACRRKSAPMIDCRTSASRRFHENLRF